MRKSTRRTATVLAVSAFGASALGMQCAPVVTLESLQAQVEAQRSALCAVYAERGLSLDLPTFDDPDCP